MLGWKEIVQHIEIKQYYVYTFELYELPRAVYGWLKKYKQIKRVVFNGNYKMLVVEN